MSEKKRKLDLSKMPMAIVALDILTPPFDTLISSGEAYEIKEQARDVWMDVPESTKDKLLGLALAATEGIETGKMKIVPFDEKISSQESFDMISVMMLGIIKIALIIAFRCELEVPRDAA